ncbi:MAG: M20/M25/M40 family metallo-hydrolase [Sandarakinorhabdus sp.]|nr:M20/M25/M40 family metallo-hydrolase [Sandarakinorhabdus sp.]
MGKILVLVATLVMAAIIGFAAAAPPAPLPATAAADQFAAGRAMADVREVAKVPHSSGSPENAANVVYLVGRLKALGFDVRTSTTPMPEKGRQRLKDWGSPYAATAQVTNIIALRPGRDPAGPAVLMMAHHDSVWASPGAADDGAGVAAALEIARAIPRETQARDLVVLLTDAEELGLFGAKEFFAPPPAGDPLAGRIGAIVNMETRGGGGRAFMFETGANAGEMIGLYQQAVHQPSTTSMAVKLYKLLPNSTDYTAAEKLGIPGFNLAFTGRAGLYHSPLATPDNLEQGALQHLGSQGLDLTRALVTAPKLPAAAPDLVFGDVLGLFTFAWPPLFNWLLVAVAAGTVALAARRTRAQWRWAGVLGGAIDGIGFAALAAGLLYLGNLLSGADGETNYYDRLAALPRLETQALVLMSAGLCAALALLSRRRGLWDGWIGLSLLSLILAVVMQVVLPAAGAIFVLPLLLAALAMLVAAYPPPLATPAAMVAAIPALAWVGGLAHGILLGIGAGIPSAAAVFAPMAYLLLWPLLPRVSLRGAGIGALLLVAVAGGIALWVRLDAPAASIPPYPARK